MTPPTPPLEIPYAAAIAQRDRYRVKVERLEAENRELREKWEKHNLCGICPYREAVQAENRELQETLDSVTKERDALRETLATGEGDHGVGA